MRRIWKTGCAAWQNDMIMVPNNMHVFLIQKTIQRQQHDVAARAAVQEEDRRLHELDRSYKLARFDAEKAKAASPADVAKARQQIQEATAARIADNERL